MLHKIERLKTEFAMFLVQNLKKKFGKHGSKNGYKQAR